MAEPSSTEPAAEPLDRWIARGNALFVWLLAAAALGVTSFLVVTNSTEGQIPAPVFAYSSIATFLLGALVNAYTTRGRATIADTKATAEELSSSWRPTVDGQLAHVPPGLAAPADHVPGAAEGMSAGEVG